MEEQEQPKDEVVQDQVEQAEPEVKEDRPEENYKAELARKNAEIARLRSLAEEKESKVVKYDPQDITTWNDNELKMLVKSPDANLARYKDQAEDLLLERKVKQMQAKQYEEGRKLAAHQELESKYPEALDPSSDMAQKISKVMQEYDLSRTPAGRLVAAKIVAAEGKASVAKGQSTEKERVARVKGQMVDGDRPKPTEVKNPEAKTKEQKEKLMDSRSESGQTEAISQILKDRGMDRQKFFGR